MPIKPKQLQKKRHEPRQHTTDMFDLHFEDLVSTPKAARRWHVMAYLVAFSLVGSSLTAVSLTQRVRL